MSSPEYLQFRCCMCPNIDQDSSVCPGIPGALHPDPSPCRFVKEYADDSEWRYKVKFQPRTNDFAIVFKIPRRAEWIRSAIFQHFESFDEGQSMLNLYAEFACLKEVSPDG